MNAPKLVLVCAGDEPNATELALQQRLALSLLTQKGTKNSGQTIASPYYLHLEAQGLTLYATAMRGRGGLRVDFGSAALQRRARQGLKNQGLGKAIGFKANVRPRVLDATAGLGTDAFLLASHGCQVQLWERSPVVFAMLEDGWRRGREAGGKLATVLERMSLRQAQYGDSACDVITGADVVYLDPMFPPTSKAARSKKAMTFLQDLLPAVSDDEALLRSALMDAGKRVVVKRARLSPYLAGKEPDLCFRGSSNRYDVYLVR